ncbi:hypothetical protein ABXS73_09260 [Intestinimonas butyriciproducens]
MEIKATPKEIAALVLALQGQRNQEAVDITQHIADELASQLASSHIPE